MQHTSWQEARELLYQAGRSQERIKEEIPLDQAVGRTLAEDASALLPVPHYDSSAMDGYATAGAPPWQLLESPPAAEGENIHRRVIPLQEGQATPILTGGLLPPGAQSVIRLERAQLQGSRLVPTPQASGSGLPAPGADIRRAGEEIAAGSKVLPAGHRLTARHLGALATLGLDRLAVWARPTLALAYTGNEIIDSGLPAPGQVRDAYSMAFPQIMTGFGAQVVGSTRLADSPSALTNWLSSTSADLLLVTGGSSRSRADWLRPVLADLGASYLFEAVAVRPGHPALAARLPASSNPAQPLVLGVPGNPLAAYTALYSYLPPWLKGALGEVEPKLGSAIIDQDLAAYSKEEPRLLPALLRLSAQGTVLTPLPKTQSHMLTSFATADALAILPAQGARAGSTLSYLPLFL